MQISKSDGVGETDSPGFSRRHKSEASDKEDFGAVDSFPADTRDLDAQSIGYWEPEPAGERGSTNRGTVIELDSRGITQIELSLTPDGSAENSEGLSEAERHCWGVSQRERFETMRGTRANQGFDMCHISGSKWSP